MTRTGSHKSSPFCLDLLARLLLMAAWPVCNQPPPQVIACVSAPIDTLLLPCGSLGNNTLCGINESGKGTYTTEGIAKLCEAVQGSAVTSLKCATTPTA